MKAYRVTLVILDTDELGGEGIKEEILSAHYANDCISPHVVRVEEADIGEWTDDHPLNQRGSDKEAPFRNPTVL